MTTTLRDRAAIAGVGTTAFGRRGEFCDRTAVDLIAEAFERALEDSGIERREVDGVSSYLDDANAPSLLAPALGIREVRYAGMVFGGGGGGACAAVSNAAAAVATGQAHCVLVFKSLQQPAHARLGAAYGADYTGGDRSEFHRAFGLVAPGQMCAMIFRRHMHLYGTRPTALAAVAVAERAHAQRNPRALLRSPMTIEDHQCSRMISEPFRLFDYCQENEGAVAILVTTPERARDARKRPVLFLAAAHGGDADWGQALTLQQATDPLYATGGHGGLARRLWEMAGVGAKDVDVALLYDHFTGMVILQLEDYGFCARGEGGPFVESGAIRWPDGEIPVNTHGGHLSEVYLLGMTHVVEGVRQLRGESTAQVADAEIALVTAGSSNLPSSSLLLRH